LKTIGKSAFENCNILSSFSNDTFYIPENVGDYAFKNCDFRNINIKTILNVDNGEDDAIEKSY
jgi:hypothetical protein